MAARTLSKSCAPCRGRGRGGQRGCFRSWVLKKGCLVRKITQQRHLATLKNILMFEWPIGFDSEHIEIFFKLFNGRSSGDPIAYDRIHKIGIFNYEARIFKKSSQGFLV